jgi:two-component system, cell cycle sensor histidine kinase and response regulator CckA
VVLIARPTILEDARENTAGLISLTEADLLTGERFGEHPRESQTMTNRDGLAAGIAHDFNNVLNIIQSYAALIMSDPAESNNVVAHAKVIRATVEEGVALVRQLLALGGKTETNFDLADINRFIRRTTNSLISIFPAATVIAAELDPRIPMIMFDAHLIYQAILNLCINARDAMPAGGRILVQTGTTSGAAIRQCFPRARAEQYIYISVADTGIGMETDVRSRVFEPYFTTKERGQGTGLGLSRVHAIVTEHAGFVDVSSEAGCGSTFRIYLPIPGDHVAGDDVGSS